MKCYTIDDIDVFILAHNRTFLLEETIKSVLNQTVKPNVLTVFDNDSTLDVCGTVKKFEKEGVRYVRTFGFGGNFFKSRDYTSRPYVIRLHDDNLIHPKFFEKVLFVLNNFANVSVVTSNITLFGSEGGSNDSKVFHEGCKHHKQLDSQFICMDSFYDFVRHHIMAAVYGFPWVGATAFSVVKSELFKSYKLAFDKLAKADDIDFIKHCCAQGNYVCLTDANSAYFRCHSDRDSINETNSLDIEQMKNLCKYYIDALKETRDSETWLTFFKYLHLIYNQDTLKKDVLKECNFKCFIQLLYEEKTLPPFTKKIYQHFQQKQSNKFAPIKKKLFSVNFRILDQRVVVIYLLGFKITVRASPL